MHKKKGKKKSVTKKSVAKKSVAKKSVAQLQLPIAANPVPSAFDQKKVLVQVQDVRLADLQFDRTYQRPLNMARVQKLREDFRPFGIEVLVVSERADGSLWGIDGQHRTHVLLGLGYEFATARIHVGLTVQEEAEMYLVLNRGQKTPTVMDLFKASLIAGDPEALELNAAFTSAGYTIGNNTQEVRWIRAAEHVMRAYGKHTLRAALLQLSRLGRDITINTLTAFCDAIHNKIDPSPYIHKLIHKGGLRFLEQAFADVSIASRQRVNPSYSPARGEFLGAQLLNILNQNLRTNAIPYPPGYVQYAPPNKRRAKERAVA